MWLEWNVLEVQSEVLIFIAIILYKCPERRLTLTELTPPAIDKDNSIKNDPNS